MATIITSLGDLKSLSLQDVMQKAGASHKGLSTQEAQQRLERDGLNEITQTRVNPILKFIGHFWGPISWMIESAAILSAILGRWDDFIIILAMLILNGIVGFWQEFKAGNAIETLKRKLAPHARVLRDGKWLRIEANRLVIGDVVRLRGGDTVPADIKLFDDGYLQVDESALTGESMPVDKHRQNAALSGSLVRQGEMTGMVAATGMDTLFGKTAGLVGKVEAASHFQKAVVKIGDYLIVLAIALISIVILVALFRGESFLQTLQFSLVLVVAAVPVALPAVLSVTMAVGAMALARKEAIVSKLVAIEEMAGVDVLCSDKTGTITKNQISVANVIPLQNEDEKHIITCASLCSRMENGDPIDEAVLARLGELKGSVSKYRVTEYIPFDPVRKRTEAVVQFSEGKAFRVAKGAPQMILTLLPENERATVEIQLNKTVQSLASHGYRSLGVAKTSENGFWMMIGLLALLDPPQDDSIETIRTASVMGLNVKMVTGDHAEIAREIASAVGIGTVIYDGETLEKATDYKARSLVEEANCFAQVYPEHKFRIVELLQNNGHIVAMTGDGVNDAPALRKADVGIAVAGATDAAKAAASIVLTRSGLSVIIDAVQQSRRIFRRMTNYATYRIAETMRVLCFITLSIVVFKFYPITALMVVLLALLNDAPIMAIAYDNVLYSPKPEKWNLREIIMFSGSLSIIGVLESFFMLFLGREILRLDQDVLQSFIYLKLSVAGHLMLLNVRTKGPFWQVKPATVLLAAIVSTQIIATIIVVYGIWLPATGWTTALIVWAEALAVFLIVDFLKIRIYRVIEHEELGYTHGRAR